MGERIRCGSGLCLTRQDSIQYPGMTPQILVSIGLLVFAILIVCGINYREARERRDRQRQKENNQA